MKLTTEVKLNLKTKEATKQVKDASRLAMRDTVVAVHGDSIRNAKSVGFWKTGHNARSIAAEVSGMGMVASGGEGTSERMVDDSKIEGAVYSTSGYGGYGETGTYKMAGRPYFKPALDRNFTQEKFATKVKEYLK